MPAEFDDLIQLYHGQKHLFEQFRNAVVDCFKLEPSLNKATNPIIHTIKSRLKDPDHLRDKLRRKSLNPDGEAITLNNVFSRITDLAGIRILHLHQDQFPKIHSFINEKVKCTDWVLAEKPTAYSWDPEAAEFFKSFDLEVKIKESYYTSIHYLVKPRIKADVCCEIQVRTLFEEIWGEIDHVINYPEPTELKTCKEQLRVLAKLVSTGTRLADSIFRAHYDAAKTAAEDCIVPSESTKSSTDA